jgi:MGT family glycosyltransferase
MAVVLAYTAPAIGHLFPFCALLDELARRGHQVHVRTLGSGVGLCRRLGFSAQPVDPRIESLQSDDSDAGGALQGAGRTVEVLVERAGLEVADINAAVDSVTPDIVLIDANCWGAMSAAETWGTPWLVFSPFIPYLDGPKSPPFGPGYPPWAGGLGRIRDLGVKMVTSTIFDRPLRNGLNPVRTALRLPPVRSADELMRRAPGVLVATGKPFEYRHTEWGASVHMIGPANFEPPSQQAPAWLDEIERPVVLVTTSSVRQADTELVRTALRALDDEDVHVVATLPAGGRDIDADAHPHATVTGFVPHSAVLDRAVCVVAHGGMGITQKALSRGIPVCVVPFGRDQFEVARRVEVARCGTRLPARRLNVRRLRDSVLSAMAMAEGAQAVAAGFAATGGMGHGANVVERHLGIS